MKYCPKCKEYRDDSSTLYCNVCGEKLIDEEQIYGCITCPKCGTENQRDDKYCSKCGISFISEITETISL